MNSGYRRHVPCNLRRMWTDKQHSHSRLMAEKVAWMTTVSASGVPSTAPVWYFVESDTEMIVYSRDPSIRVRNVAVNERVTFNLTTDAGAGDVVVLNGRARIDKTADPADKNEAFVAKYQEQLDNYKWTAKWFADNYPTAIRITIRSVRGE
jgi:PPOX class probable F420-dependent enzyme